jgi:hypothetical protein
LNKKTSQNKRIEDEDSSVADEDDDEITRAKFLDSNSKQSSIFVKPDELIAGKSHVVLNRFQSQNLDGDASVKIANNKANNSQLLSNP